MNMPCSIVPENACYKMFWMQAQWLFEQMNKDFILFLGRLLLKTFKNTIHKLKKTSGDDKNLDDNYGVLKTSSWEAQWMWR